MRTSTLADCGKLYSKNSGWQEMKNQRTEKLNTHPFSVIVEGAFPELDMAEKWLQDFIGPDTDDIWKKMWFGKITYDYGFMEFYFKDNSSLNKFSSEIPSFYGTGPDGKWKTDGSEKFTPLE